MKQHLLERESSVERYLEKRVKERGGLCLKFPADYARGIPDRLILMPGGIALFVELKRPGGGRLSASQQVRIHQLRKLGCRVEIADCKEAVDRIVSSLETHPNGEEADEK